MQKMIVEIGVVQVWYCMTVDKEPFFGDNDAFRKNDSIKGTHKQPEAGSVQVIPAIASELPSFLVM
jgi:hypothetical protein